MELSVKKLNTQLLANQWQIEGLNKLYDAAVLLEELEEVESLRTKIVMLTEASVDMRAQIIYLVRKLQK